MKNLRDLMKEKEMTISELADLTGATRQAISNYMNGHSQPNAKWLIKVSSLFGCSVDYLLDRTKFRNENEYALYYAESFKEKMRTMAKSMQALCDYDGR